VNGSAVEVEKIKQDRHQSIAITAIRSILDQAERGGIVGPDAAQLAVEIDLSRREVCERRSDCGVFMGPIKSGAGQQPDRAAFKPRLHPVAVEFEFMQPLGPVWCLIDQ
jgi:hypothetical protein